MSLKYLKKSKCLICKSSALVKYLDLGTSVPANSFLKKSELQKKEKAFPLQVFYCTECHLAQLTDPVDRKLLFQKYPWFSSASPQLEAYFKTYTENIYATFPQQTKKLIVEIGSNDGILLKYFEKNGARVLGIDPAKNITKVANKAGIETIPLFFNSYTANKILKKYGKAGIIIANHVIAHTDDSHNIMQGIRELLDTDGVFIFEVQYLADLIEKNEFDNTYHEHVCYFSLAPLVRLLKQHGLEIFNVEQTDAQGGSIRVFAGHTPLCFPIDASVKKMLAKEKKQGLYNLKTYTDFSKKPKNIKKDLQALLKKIKKEEKTIVGYGASAKGNTMLQYCGINNKTIEYIVDDSPYKQGMFTPATHIPIYPSKKLKTDTPDYILILAWNYADAIMQKEAWVKKKGVRFIKPIPYLQIL